MPTRNTWLSGPPAVSTAWEDARLDAFFLYVGARPNPAFTVMATRAYILNGHSAREAWSVDNAAQGGTTAFLRANWLDRARAIISFGVVEGRGRTDVWKARFGPDGAVLEAHYLGDQLGSSPITHPVARLMWYLGTDGALLQDSSR